jgi:hypothetical protein
VTIIEPDLVTTAILTMLNAALPFEVYDHAAPTSRAFPYAVLYKIPGGASWGPWLYDPDADRTMVYQVDGVGQRRDQAEWAAGKIDRVMVGRVNGQFEYPLALPGSVALCDRMRTELGGGVEVEGLQPNWTFTVPNRYEVSVTPS